MVGQQKISNYLIKSAAGNATAGLQRSSTTNSRNAGSAKSLKKRASNDDGGPAPPKQRRCDEAKARLLATAKKIPAVHANMGLSWFEALEPEFSKPYFLTLNEFLIEERKHHVVYPPEDKVYTWTRMCDIKSVKVVILGQDPYHGPNQAHGLSFSVHKGVAPPPSLLNMYEELMTDIPNFQKPSHGNLSGWARQGVLLLNASLTVRAHVPNSHSNKGWEQFTDAVISWLNHNLNGVVFILWGAYAQKKAFTINKSRHRVLQCPHPSPFSARRGFFGCRHFSKANELLLEQGKKAVDWTRLPSNGDDDDDGGGQ